jgi:hypothetical protein
MNRMRRIPPSDMQGQQSSLQTHQVPNASQQFPPDQQAPATAPGQRPPMRFPHPIVPGGSSNPQPGAEPTVSTPPAQQPVQAAKQQEEPSGRALQPAKAPRVSFAAGELAITADNSAMTDVLRAVERATGAHIEGTHSDPERVFGQFGPGTPRNVLNSLLSGSGYDFILVGAIEDPGAVQRIVLTPRGTSLAGSMSAANQGPFRPAQPSTEEVENEGFAQPEPVAEQPPQPTQQVQPLQQQVKTPEQLLQELQRLRQQQQQQTTNPR